MENCSTGCQDPAHMTICMKCGQIYHIGLIHHCLTMGHVQDVEKKIPATQIDTTPPATCPIDRKHKVFTSFVFDKKLEKIDVVACPTCKKVWYAK